MNAKRFGSLAAAGAMVLFSTPLFADEQPVMPRVRHTVVQKSPYCGCQCGCPLVTYVRHRETLMAYPSAFDPRQRDEPVYFYGGMKSYARFYKATTN